MTDFVIPALSQNIRDVELSGEGLRAQDVSPVHQDLSEAEQIALVEDLSSREQSIWELIEEDQAWFDSLYSLVRFYDELGDGAKGAVLEMLCAFNAQCVRAVAKPADDVKMDNLKTSLKFVVYFLAKICVDEERRLVTSTESAAATQQRKGRPSKKSKNSTYDWNSCRLLVLTSLLRTLCTKDAKTGEEKLLDFGSLWDCGLPEEAFLDLFWRVSETLVLENPKLLSSSEEMLTTLEDLICYPVHMFHGTLSHVVAASFSHALSKSEAMPVFVAGVLHRLVDKHNDDRLPRELILEIGRMETHEASKDTAGVKNLGLFMEELASRLPALALSNLSVLIPHLNAHAYPLRCSVLKALGTIVAHLKSNESAEVATRDRLLDLIGERAHDTSSYVRVVAVGTFARLQEESALPLTHIHVATDIASERVLDKSSLVRKQAIACLSCLLERNPYSDRLNSEFFKERILEAQAELDSLKAGSSSEGKAGDESKTTPIKKEKTSDEDENKSVSNEDDELLDEEDTSAQESNGSDKEGGDDEEEFDDALENSENKVEKADGNEDDDEDDSEDPAQDKAKANLLGKLHYFKSALGFTARMSHACEQAQLLVCSKVVTDVLESLRFLCAATRFKLPAAGNAIRKVLSLIWDDRESGRIKKELLETFELVYLSEPVIVGRVTKRKLYAEDVIVQNLIDLVLDTTLAELTSLDRIIAELVTPEGALGRLALPSAVLERVLIRAMQDREDDPRASRAAMCIVSMASSSSQSLFERNPSFVPQMLDLVETSTNDLISVKYSFQTLFQIFQRRPLTERYGERVEKAVASLLLVEIQSVELESQWYAAAEVAVNLMVICTGRADLACARLMRKLHNRTFQHAETRKVSEAALSRLFFVAGQVAVQLFVNAEDLCSEAKRVRKGQEDAKLKQQSMAEREEMTMLGAGGDSADDQEEMILKRIAESELVAPRSLLGTYVPLMASVVTSAHRASKQNKISALQEQDENQPDGESSATNGDHELAGSIQLETSSALGSMLMESAILSLCKVMCVSQTLCEKHLKLIFTVLRDSPDPSVRSNIMIALGDLAVRFPNTIEPFTSQIYRRLRDPNIGVRKTSLMVLTHLILNDMIKIRGEVSEIALCLEDPDSDRIRDLTRLFFHELSRKGTNPVYNLLPDTLNKLSCEPGLSTEKFQTIAKFLLQFITLDKQVLSITDKLCNRIFAATGLTPGAEEVESLETLQDLKLCRDLAFCIAQLKHSDKGIKKLSDPLFKLYRPLLADEDVYGSMMTVIRKCRQFCKAEVRKSLDEWEAHINELREGQIANQATTDKARKRLAKKGTKTTKKSGPLQTANSTSRPKRKTAVSSKKKVLDSDSEESDADFELQI
mmetsp:Transcript_17787/g.35139  ORF Transcript_17787/g.35139 Transcript_17787/m.35139 type:complete len:1366 (+) Transcript_17787:329-4426(+)|eukprot:CAMPEP_0171571694 /NCGR_PEP_ID=MMETSP0961-20121227/3653_1 /TAXON_ID=87120 /ORGANISM="Aurantiochytrium limacinum, Strain ATCCMYA-1381" /LENGTH=1365 /DNA_ID=CAMNT_0012126345 /DNA_START=273 /DNA_END=4370 /DNA_ORIENTATION=-